MASKQIKCKEDLSERIHELHDFMRNKGIGYGMAALNTFNLFYGLKLLEPLIENGKIKHQDAKKCLYSKIVDMARSEGKSYVDDDQLLTYIVGNNGVLDLLWEIPELKETIFHEITKEVKAEVYRNLIKQIDDIIKQVDKNETKYDVHLAGNVYEYFIGRNSKDIEDLGAYFTNRDITNFIMNKIKPKPTKKGKVRSFIDPFAGSGGFTLNYVKKVMGYAKKKDITINWEKEVNKVWHVDINPDVIRMARMELFALTHVFPKVHGDDAHVFKSNSFEYDFVRDKENLKFDIVMSNPPYGGGGNKSSKVTALTCSDIIKRYVCGGELPDKPKGKKNPANMKIICNDKESCSIALFLSLLKEDGILCAVLKEGVFFDRKYKTLWEDMVENYNITDIISVPQDAFNNTTTKTSILILRNNGKTEDINFSEITMSDGKVIEKELVKVSYKELKKHEYVLNYKKYIKIEEEVSDEFEMMAIGDIVEFLPKSKRKAADGKEKGEYKFYTSSDTYKYCGGADINSDDNTIIIGSGGNGSLFMDKKFSCSGDNILLRSNESDEKTQYIFHCLVMMRDKLTATMSGSTIKHLTKDTIITFKIPMPKSDEWLSEYVEYTTLQYNLKIDGNELLKKLEREVQLDIKQMCKENECDEYKLGDVCELQDGYNFYRNEMDSRMKFIENENYPLIKVNGKSSNDYIVINKKYEKYVVKKNDITIGITGSYGNIQKIDINIGYHVHGLLKFLNISIDSDYLYYYLKMILVGEKLNKMMNISVIPYMKKEDLLNIGIKIPKDDDIVYELKKSITLIESVKEKIESSNKKYDSQIEQLKKQVNDE